MNLLSMYNHRMFSIDFRLTIIFSFSDNYGRWIGFDTAVSPEALLATIRKSSLLLCACSLIAVRHTTQELAAKLAPLLFEKAKGQLTSALLTSPQQIEFFQAALILCMWSTTVGQTPLSIDSWLLSGFALQHCFSSDSFGFITTRDNSTSHSRRKLNIRCIWNHLCLVHLQFVSQFPLQELHWPVKLLCGYASQSNDIPRSSRGMWTDFTVWSFYELWDTYGCRGQSVLDHLWELFW